MNQLEYLATKSTHIVDSSGFLDGKSKLEAKEIKDLTERFAKQWQGGFKPKLGQTTHMLMSFPIGTRGEDVRDIATDVAERFFQTDAGHFDYIIAVHEDRDHPQPIGTDRVIAALFQTDDVLPRQSLPATHHAPEATTETVGVTMDVTSNEIVPVDLDLRRIQDRADIDISGPEFNFVRSIRVFDVWHAQQHEAGCDGDCKRSAVVIFGTYQTQGDFFWQKFSIRVLSYCPFSGGTFVVDR